MNSIKIYLPVWRKYLSRLFLMLLATGFLGCEEVASCMSDAQNDPCGEEVSIRKGFGDPVILTDKNPTVRVITAEACLFQEAQYTVYYQYHDIPTEPATVTSTAGPDGAHVPINTVKDPDRRTATEKDKPLVTVKFGTVEHGVQKDSGKPYFDYFKGWWAVAGSGVPPIVKVGTIPDPLHWVLNVTMQRPLISLPGVTLPFIGQIAGSKPRDVDVLIILKYKKSLVGGALIIEPPSRAGEFGKDYTFTAKSAGPPTKARYEWTVDGKPQATETNIIKVNIFPGSNQELGLYPITCELYDAAQPDSAFIAKGFASLTIIAPLTIDPPEHTGEPGKEYTFTAKSASPPAKARYEWTVDGTPQATRADVIKVDTSKWDVSKAGDHPITCELYDAAQPDSAFIAKASASLTITSILTIDPPSLKGEPGKDYTFTAKTASPPARARYEWTMDGTLQASQTNVLKLDTSKLDTSKAVPHPITCKLYDAAKPGSTAVDEASASLTIIAPLPIVPPASPPIKQAYGILTIDPPRLKIAANKYGTFTAKMNNPPAKARYEWTVAGDLQATETNVIKVKAGEISGASSIACKVYDAAKPGSKAIAQATAVFQWAEFDESGMPIQ